MIKEVSLGHTLRLCHEQNEQTQVEVPGPTEAPNWESKAHLSSNLVHETKPGLHIPKWGFWGEKGKVLGGVCAGASTTWTLSVFPPSQQAALRS